MRYLVALKLNEIREHLRISGLRNRSGLNYDLMGINNGNCKTTFEL